MASRTFAQKVDRALPKLADTDWKRTGCGHKQKDHVTRCCVTCKINLCDSCADTHAAEAGEHVIENIETAGARVKEKYRTMLDSINSSSVETSVAKSLNRFKTQATFQDGTFKVLIRDIKQKLNDLLRKVDDIEKTVGNQLTDNAAILAKMSSDLKDYVGAKDQLRDYLVKLVNQASDPEVVGSEKNLPVYDITAYKETLHESSIDIPVFTTQLTEVQALLARCQQDLNVSYVNEKVAGNQPVKRLTILDSFPVYETVNGLIVDSVRDRVIIRTQSAAEPIISYDFKGGKKQILGKGVDGIAKSGCQGIAIDTKRDLLILPVANGYLITMNMDGEVVDKIKVVDGIKGLDKIRVVDEIKVVNGIKVVDKIKMVDPPLHAAAYGCYSDDDFYVTSTCGPHGVYLINAETKQVVSTFRPDYHTEFNGPYHACCGQYTPPEGATTRVVIVSDRNNHCVKVLDFTGRLVHVYGREGVSGDGEGEFDAPGGVCTDPAGRIIVGDRQNARVVSVWTEGKRDNWLEPIEGSNKLTNNGQLVVACDAASRKLFVTQAQKCPGENPRFERKILVTGPFY